MFSCSVLYFTWCLQLHTLFPVYTHTKHTKCQSNTLKTRTYSIVQNWDANNFGAKAIFLIFSIQKTICENTLLKFVSRHAHCDTKIYHGKKNCSNTKGEKFISFPKIIISLLNLQETGCNQQEKRVIWKQPWQQCIWG